MDAVKSWAAMLCVVAVGCALVQMLAPRDGMGKIMKLIIAAFFLCCMVSPLLSIKSLNGLNLDLLPDEISADMLQERVNEQLKQQMAAAVEKVADKTLKNYGISAEKVIVKTDTSEEGGIYIRQVILYLNSQNIQKALTARQVMEQQLGVDVSVEEEES